MTTWRLHSHIRVVAIGGEIEFGESWQAALVRKFHEELGIGISIVKAMS
jgi:ADP-ribose pyrophosphatase YjhB (NUDIX family)